METDSKIKMAMNIQIIIDDIRNAESSNVRNNLNTSVPSKETKKLPLVHIQMAATIYCGAAQNIQKNKQNETRGASARAK